MEFPARQSLQLEQFKVLDDRRPRRVRRVLRVLQSGDGPMEEPFGSWDVLHEVLLQQRVVQQSQGVLALRDAVPVVHGLLRDLEALSTRIPELGIFEHVQSFSEYSFPRCL